MTAKNWGIRENDDTLNEECYLGLCTEMQAVEKGGLQT